MSSIINAGTSGVTITGSTSTVLSLATNGTNRVTIDTSGNLGIGTASPDGKLDIATGGSGDVVAGLGGSFPAFTYRNGSGSWFHAGKSPTSDYFYIGYGGTPTANIAMVVNGSGDVGIGKASASTKLDVSGTITGTNIIITGEYSGTISGGTY